GQRGLAMVDMGDDGKIADILERRGHGALIAEATSPRKMVSVRLMGVFGNGGGLARVTRLMRMILLPLAALLLAPAPLAAQDFLQPLQDLVEDLAPRPAPTPTPADERPEAEPEEAPPPLPRPRPEEAETSDEAAEPVAEEEAEAPRPERVYQTACPA